MWLDSLTTDMEEMSMKMVFKGIAIVPLAVFWICPLIMGMGLLEILPACCGLSLNMDAEKITLSF